MSTRGDYCWVMTGRCYTTGTHQHTEKKKPEKESHIPIIDCPEKVRANETFSVKITLGNGAGHPDTEAHHVRRLSLYYSNGEGKVVRQIAGVDFNARGFNKDAPYSNYETLVTAEVPESGVLHAMAYCNIHGLAEAVREITVI